MSVDPNDETNTIAAVGPAELAAGVVLADTIAEAIDADTFDGLDEIAEALGLSRKVEDLAWILAMTIRHYANRTDELEADLAATTRELERWRHGQPIEGDHVCPNELEATNAKARIAELEAGK